MNSGELIVAEAFGAHFIREVGRSQLVGAAKTLLNKEERQELKGVEKAKYILPLAEALLRKKIVQVTAGASFSSLSRTDEAPFRTCCDIKSCLLWTTLRSQHILKGAIFCTALYKVPCHTYITMDHLAT